MLYIPERKQIKKSFTHFRRNFAISLAINGCSYHASFVLEINGYSYHASFVLEINGCSYHASFVLKLWFNGVNVKVTEELRTYNALIKQDE